MEGYGVSPPAGVKMPGIKEPFRGNGDLAASSSFYELRGVLQLEAYRVSLSSGFKLANCSDNSDPFGVCRGRVY